MLTLREDDAAAVPTCANALRAGGVIVAPTDTVYGLAADATNPTAVAMVRAIKGTTDGRPLLALVDSVATIGAYAHVTDEAEALAARFLPGPLSLILRVDSSALSGIATAGKVGFRVPNHPFSLELARALGRPMTSTSANPTGLPPEPSPEAIVRALGRGVRDIAILVDGGTAPRTVPSTIIDASAHPAVLIREGAIARAELEQCLGTVVCT